MSRGLHPGAQRGSLFDADLAPKGVPFARRLTHLVRLLGQQPGKTVQMLGQTLLWAAGTALGLREADPQLGMRYAYADPATAPWEGFMLLSDNQRKQLAAADAERLRRKTYAAPEPAATQQHEAFPVWATG